MLNTTAKTIVYLDPDSLGYMYLTYSKQRNYPVMNKLFTLLRDYHRTDLTVTPLTTDHVLPYIEENKIDRKFFTMMGELGQVQFHQRFTVTMLQFIRVFSTFFKSSYKKEIWRDAFTADPDCAFQPGFNIYSSLTAQHLIQMADRERKLCRMFLFIEKFRSGVPATAIAAEYYTFILNEFRDLVQPYIPQEGTPEQHLERFLMQEELKDIPEFHISSQVIYPLFETYGIGSIENGVQDNLLRATGTLAAYMPYSHFYVTSSEIVKLVKKTGLDTLYHVNVYDNNESSLYQLMIDLVETVKRRKTMAEAQAGRTVFRRTSR